MPILIKLAVSVACGVLDALGGHSFLWMRRYMIPIVLGVCFSIITHVWWVGLMVLPTIGTLSLGYGKAGNAGRGFWLFLQAFVIALGVTLTGHLSWFIFVPYVVIAGVLGGIYKNWQQILGDLVTGTWLGIVVLFVR